MSENNKERFGRAHAGVKSETTDHGWAKGRVTQLDASTTVVHLEKVADADIKLEFFKTAINGRYETFEIGGQNFNKFLGVEATVSLIALDVGEGTLNITLGVGVDNTFGIKDQSLDVSLFGMGFKIGKVMGISFLGSEINMDVTRLFEKYKTEDHMWLSMQM